ncbi:histidine kinase [Actinopolymorpha alba]|uniref:histidine kinase n=1 Tax=Actinopolymorpha alba TaxID=533267 RepID=UPI000371AAEE|nr:histidine kinase [Actinopolymorpha alba]
MTGLVHQLGASTRADRDRAVDALRAFGVLGVVLGHWLVTAVVVDSGTLRGASPLQYIGWLAPFSWLFQTLAIFYLVGGYAAVRSLASARDQGMTTATWLRRRIARLFTPAIQLLAVWIASGGLLLACGVEPTTARLLVNRAVAPLWFLLVFAVLTVLTPVVAKLHPLVPLIVVAAVDLARFGFAVPDRLGAVNVIAAWLVPYCLGTAWARGALNVRKVGAVLLVGGAVATVGLVVLADYPVSMVGVPGAEVSNVNPPTLASVTFGLTQCGAALLLAGWLRRACSRPAVWIVVALVNVAAMTVFLWHQTALLVVTASGLFAGRPFPGLHTAPDDLGWLLARLAWIPAFVLVLLLCCAAFMQGPHLRTVLGFVRHRRGRSVAARVNLVRRYGLTERLLDAVRAAPRTVADDLWRNAASSPSDRPPWRLTVAAVFAQVAIILPVTGANEYQTEFGIDILIGCVLAIVQSAAMVAALFRPVAAWWVATIVTVVAAIFLAGPVSPDSAFPWTITGIAVQAGVHLAVALRTPLRVAIETYLLTIVVGVGCGWLGPQGSRLGGLPLVITVFAAAVVVGASLRGRRVARTEQRWQEERAAHERSRRTVLEERARIARELHDVVAHHLSLISIQAQVAAHLAKNPSDQLSENLTGIRSNAVEALAELRRVLGVLRSEDLATEDARYVPQPTLDRLDQLVANARGAGVDVLMQATGAPRTLPPGVELSAFRIVQEALSNAIRHAPGATIRIELRYRPGSLLIRVTNGAPDRAVEPRSGAGHGLLGMRERVAMLEGDLVTRPTPDGGYEVIANLPTGVGVEASDLVRGPA